MFMRAPRLPVRHDREREADSVAGGHHAPIRPRPIQGEPSPLERGLARVGRQSTGLALPDPIRTNMGERMGADFDAVRVHHGPRSQAIARSVGANALTIGRDIHFASGRYDPGSARGDALIAHELAHVAQRGATGPAGATGPTEHVDADLAMSLPVPLGHFDIDMISQPSPPSANAGMLGNIEFHPDPHSPYSAEIELLQVVDTTDVGGTTSAPGSPLDWSRVGVGAEAARNTVMTTGAGPAGPGHFVDQIYDPATHAPSSATGPYYQSGTGFRGGNEPGWVRSPTDVKASTLRDGPGISAGSIDFDFETVAKGHDNQTIYGSLLWGFQVRTGAVSGEYVSASGAQSATVGEALDRFRTYFTHEPTIIYFDFDVDSPMAGEDAKLREFLPYVHAHPDVQVQVTGFADETGPARYNRGLSSRRATNVAGLIQTLGVSRSRITTAVHGETHQFAGGALGSGPFAAQAGQPEQTPGTLRANRRVVIEFQRTATTTP